MVVLISIFVCLCLCIVGLFVCLFIFIKWLVKIVLIINVIMSEEVSIIIKVMGRYLRNFFIILG